MSSLNTEIFFLLRAVGPLTFKQIQDELQLTDKDRRKLYNVIGGNMRSNIISFKTVNNQKVFYLTNAGRYRMVGRPHKFS
jgi:hypothetical protein